MRSPFIDWVSRRLAGPPAAAATDLVADYLGLDDEGKAAFVLALVQSAVAERALRRAVEARQRISCGRART